MVSQYKMVISSRFVWKNETGWAKVVPFSRYFAKFHCMYLLMLSVCDVRCIGLSSVFTHFKGLSDG